MLKIYIFLVFQAKVRIIIGIILLMRNFMQKKCPLCSSSDIKKDWRNQSGSQKIKCNSCKHCFVDRKKQKQGKVLHTRKVFDEYITEWYSVRQLAKQTKKEEYLIRSDIHYRLDNNHITCIDEVYGPVHSIMIDGYHLPWWEVLLAYYEPVIEKILWFSIRDGEKKEHVLEDLVFLRDSFQYRDIRFGICDGSKSIVWAFQKVYPNAKIQRCLVHIQRKVKQYISDNPKSPCGKELKHLVAYPTLSDPSLFPTLFQTWKNTYRDYLKEKTTTPKWKRVPTHKDINKALSHIQNVLPYMFHNESPERTTNKLEWYFWVLTNEAINEHKWLRIDRLHSLLALWIYNRNNN